MNIVIVNSSDIYEYRVDMIYNFFKKQNNRVKVLTSDFMHIEKKKRGCEKKDYIILETIPYKKNISLRRLYSHYFFSKSCIKKLSSMQFDLLYIVIPPNSQAVIAKKYAKKSNVHIMMDILDMWPESLPFKYTNIFPFSLWRNIRNNNLKYADYIITECNLYQEKLKQYLSEKNVRTIYWAHKKKQVCEGSIKEFSKIENEIHLCYLGSINNIIDIPTIGKVISSIARESKVILKIIGEGEKKDLLIFVAKQNGAVVIDYGKVYQYKEKKKIMDTCHYGLNIMKDTVCVGLSMKSIDYLECGVPIINNLQGDIAQIIREENCGINICDINWLSQVLENAKNSVIRRNAVECYQKYFSFEEFERKILKILNDLKNEGEKSNEK